jgi:hypothetical protein
VTQFHGATRALGLGLVVVVAIAVILFVWRSDATNSKAASAPESKSAPAEAAQALATPTAPPIEPVREAPKEATVAVEASAAATTRTVQGTLRFRNESANPVPASGKVVLTLGESGASREVSALHKDGVFSFPAEEDETECAVVSITIGRLEARATTARHTISAAGTLAIEIEWSPGTLLHVVDAATGAELDDVTLVAAVNAGLLGLSQPVLVPPASVRQTPLLRGQNSPFPLPRAASVVTCWLRAPGHAWTSVHFEGGEGERRVALPRESTLELRVTWDTSSKRSVFLKLRDAHSGELLLRERLESQAPLERFEGLSPGTWAAELVHTVLRGEDVVLVRTTLELRPGETATWNVASLADGLRQTGGVDLRIKASKGAKALHFASLIGPLPATAEVEPVAAALTHRSETEEWTGTLRGLAPGEYRLVVSTWNLRRDVSVFESQVTPVEITIDRGDLVPLVVRILDANGALLESAQVFYESKLEHGARAEIVPVHFDAQAQCWKALLLPGPVDVVTGAPGFASSRKSVVVSEAGLDLDFTLGASADLPLLLTARSGRALVPIFLDEWTRVRIESLDGSGANGLRSFSGTSSMARSRMNVTLPAPGRYRVTLPRGFADLASERSFEVDVLDGSGAELELQLDG